MVVYFQVSYLMKKKKKKGVERNNKTKKKYIESKLDRQINFDLRVLQNKSWPKKFF